MKLTITKQPWPLRLLQAKEEGRGGGRGNVLFNERIQHILFTVISKEKLSERENPLPLLYELLCTICSKRYFICTIPQTVVEHWLGW